MERNTMQKRVVSQALQQLANHPTADAVYQLVNETQPSISKATVYRILSNMAENGSALRVRINNGADHFDHQVFPHHHVRCMECGRVDDVIIPAIDNLDCAAAQASGYRILAHTLQFDGICPDCQQKQSEGGQL